MTANHRWPLFSDVVSDHSYANLNALVIGFNGITLLDYFNDMFLVYSKGTQLNPNYVRIHLCIFHVNKNWKKEIETTASIKNWSDEETNEIKSMFAAIYYIRDYETFRNYFSNLIIVLASKHENEDFKKR